MEIKVMQDYRSDFKENYHHPKVVVSLSAGLDSDADWMLRYFESEIKKGVVFHANETVQIGWMIVKLQSDEHGDLEIWEPRFDSMPINWVRGASNTFRHLTLQKEICRQIDVEPNFPSLRQSGIISSGFLGYSGGFSMSREKSEHTDSGWIFSKLDSNGLDGKHCSLFEIAVGNSAIIPFLALPSGASVQYAVNKISVSYGSADISSDSNDFLHRLLFEK